MLEPGLHMNPKIATDEFPFVHDIDEVRWSLIWTAKQTDFHHWLVQAGITAVYQTSWTYGEVDRHPDSDLDYPVRRDLLRFRTKSESMLYHLTWVAGADHVRTVA